jgi:hypothetical protein
MQHCNNNAAAELQARNYEHVYQRKKLHLSRRSDNETSREMGKNTASYMSLQQRQANTSPSAESEQVKPGRFGKLNVHVNDDGTIFTDFIQFQVVHSGQQLNT